MINRDYSQVSSFRIVSLQIIQVDGPVVDHLQVGYDVDLAFKANQNLAVGFEFLIEWVGRNRPKLTT